MEITSPTGLAGRYAVMMHAALSIHPASPGPAGLHIEVDVSRPQPHALTLRYVLSGAIGAVRLPDTVEPQRADELWRRTCFEAFLRAPDGSAYVEINLAPSTEWAAYGFSGYREGMRAAEEIGAPEFELARDADTFSLAATIDLGGVAALPGDTPWRLALSAVIEDIAGRTSYWAVKHPPGAPDFHHPDGFALELNPPE